MSQQRTLSGLVAATAVLVLVAAGIVAYALTRPTETTSGTGVAEFTTSAPTTGSPSTTSGAPPITGVPSTTGASSTDIVPSTGSPPTVPADPYRQPELSAAKAIAGLTYRVEGDHLHSTGLIRYDATPPVGGDHSPYWADCDGAVYAAAIANENAVHMLEHGAVWITYNPQTLPAADVATLRGLVAGRDGLALSPYPNLKTPISLQSWGYQLFVTKAADPRVQQFIELLHYNRATTPEYGATCSQPLFKQHPSTFGHPLSSP